MIDENIINLDLWGGEHSLDKVTLKYIERWFYYYFEWSCWISGEK